MSKILTNNQLLLKECIQQECDENGLYDSLNSFFEYFAASQILKNYDMSDDEISDGIIGGGNDGGCDGMYIFLNNDLISQDQFANLTAPNQRVVDGTEDWNRRIEFTFESLRGIVNTGC